MKIKVHGSTQRMGEAAAASGVQGIELAIQQNGQAYIILATGASQFHLLENLLQADMDWSRVHCFHLDEYVGLPMEHPASFCRYLKERFVDKLPELGSFDFVRPDLLPPDEECRRLNELMQEVTVDVAFIGIGENAHLAFNDPPADFEITAPYILVTLDEECRKQQLGEGWFTSLEEVPRTAISMSIQQILKSKQLVVTVPDERKANAVQCAVEGPVTPQCPASILQHHRNCTLFLDRGAAPLLQSAPA